jgi:hypothetical protein
MIAKLIHGKGFRGCLDYLLGASRKNPTYGSERAKLISTNLTAATARELSFAFGQLRKLKPDYGKPLSHIILSLAPEDRLNNKSFAKLARTYLREMGYADCPYSLIKHTDTDHPHCHLVVSKIKFDGTTVSTSHERRKSQILVEQLERQYRLRLTNQDKKNNQGEKAMFKSKLAQFRANHLMNESVVGAPQAELKPTVQAASEMIKPMHPVNRMTGTVSKKAKPELDPALELKFQKLIYPASTIYSMLYNNYHCDFSDDELFGSVTYVLKGINRTELQIQKKGRVVDYGESIVLENDPPLKIAVAVMLKIGIAKGWQSMVFEGSEEFLMEAWEQAEAMGVKVSPLSSQLQLWDKFQTMNSIRKFDASIKQSKIDRSANDPMEQIPEEITEQVKRKKLGR